MSYKDTNELPYTMGKRLKTARLIYNEGIKLSAEQFAHLLDITTDKLQNYETGRSTIPQTLMYELYYRGINPIYILTGEEDIFANNNVGNALRQKILNKNINYNDVIKKLETKYTK